MRRIIYIILLAVVAASCDGEMHRRLAQIEATIDSVDFPQASLDSLLAIDTTDIRSDADRALYGLLYSKLMIKNGYPLTETTRLDAALDYFERHDDRQHNLDALLYKAITLYRNDNYTEALKLFIKAQESALSLNDYISTARICEYIGKIYLNSYDPENYLKYSSRAKDYYSLTDCRTAYYYSLIDYAEALSLNGRHHKSLELLDSVSFISDYGDPMLNNYYKLSCVGPLLKTGNPVEPKHIIADVVNDSVYPVVMDYFTRQMVEIYLKENKPDSAEYWLDITETFSEPSDRQNLYSALLSVARYKGDFETASRFSDSLRIAQDEIVKGVLNDNINKSLTEYYISAAQKERQSSDLYRLKLIILSMVLALLAIISIWLLRERRRRQADLDTKIREIQELTITLQSKGLESQNLTESLISHENLNRLTDKQSTILRQSINDLWAQGFRILNELSNDYFEHTEVLNSKRNVYRTIENEIERMTRPENVAKMIGIIDEIYNRNLIRLYSYLGITKDSDRLFVALLVGGYNKNAICLLCHISANYFYVKKSRFITKLKDSDFDQKDYIIDLVSAQNSK